MTAKRFTLLDMNNIEKVLPSPIKDNGNDCLTWFEVVECLNNLHEENQSLKQSDTIADLETQIMHLKEELDYYKNKCASLETGLFEEQRRSSEAKRVLEERFGDSDSNILEKW